MLAALIASVGLCAPPLFPGGGARPIEIGPPPAGLPSADVETCALCHDAIASEWRGSQHANAWTDRLFQAAYAAEPLDACRNCHAPLNRGRPPAGVAAADGVSCSVCHVRRGAVLARSDVSAPHAVLATASLGESAFCAGCHQFGFLATVGGRQTETDEMQQDTFGEWQRSRAGKDGVTCQACHMPWVEDGEGRGHRSHAFRGGRDVAFVRTGLAIDVVARREGASVLVEATLAPQAIGHAFPTGDLFRRAELRASAGEASAAVAFTRRFKDVPVRRGGEVLMLRRESGDSRIPPPGRGQPIRRRVRLLAPAAREVRWSFDYLLMPTPGAASNGGDPVERLHVFEGTVPVLEVP